ncbi:MAG: redoxin domain-containing protein [Fimbriimonas sp.]|nr:redoxin domain-containing protein [Fimbriimonas sp.]
MPLSVGTPAPDFTLKTKTDAGLQDVTLSSHLGKDNVVLLFYPAAFTGVCTKEMCDVTSGLSQFKAASAQVYGISGDTPFALEEWSKKLQIGFPLLADYQRTVTKSYDVVWPDFAGLGEGVARAAFVIDKSGIIRYAEQTPTLADLPNFEAIQATLASL